MIALIAGPHKPPRSFQGLGLPYLAAVLEDGGFEVRICDLYPATQDTDDPAALDERLAEEIANLHPTIVGVTVHTPTLAERIRLAASLRRRMPDALLVAGGHHASAEPEDLLQRSDFDICVIGEGEYTLLEIARGAEAEPGDRERKWLAKIPGIAFKTGDRIARNGSHSPAIDVESLPVQAHRLLRLEDYAPHPNLGIRSTGLLTYRGCPVRCSFCLNPQGDNLRRRSPANAVDEMEHVVHEFGVAGFNCYDNLFGLDTRHAKSFCDEIVRRRLDVIWECWTGGDLVDRELAEKMKAAGCVRTGFGAESGDDMVLARSLRGFTAAKHRAGIGALHSAGIKTQAFFMIGLPGESRDSVRQTVEFAKRCGADSIVLGVYRPYPGTAVWQAPNKFGVRITHGPNFEAYVETEALSRRAILECAQRAGEELSRSGLDVDYLRLDRYTWE